ncbi:class I SAM-dependent methyltransferase [Arenicella xantha]|nr:class I SAM-dependent methyltransferase [Arenicella xantha]
MRQFLPTNYSKVLEIGCGEGNFRNNLEKQHEYWGVEQNQDAATKASVLLDKVSVGNYEDISNQLPKQYFDLIVCNDVLEHMENHIEFLLDLKSKLSPGGSLILSIPNVRYLSNINELLFSKDWRYRDAGVLDLTHLRFFTKKSLLRVMRQTGWKVDIIKGVNRYGSGGGGSRLVFSYIMQLIYGFDSAYLQYAVRASDESQQ